MLSAKKINRSNIMAAQVGQLLAFAYPDHGLSLQGHMLMYNRSVLQFFLNWFFRCILQSYKVSWKIRCLKRSLWEKEATRHKTGAKHRKILKFFYQSQADNWYSPHQLHLKRDELCTAEFQTVILHFLDHCGPILQAIFSGCAYPCGDVVAI